ncbi:MAG: ATP-binding protein [Steroidobacteraceae bacterium]
MFEGGEASVEAPFVAKDGTRTLYFFTGKRIEFDGRVCLVGAGVDVSARNRLEEQVRQAQKMEAIGHLAGGVAHEFNNTLAAISGNIQLAVADIAADHPARENLREIRKASERGRRIVQQLLSFARHTPLDQQVVDLGPVIEETLRFLRATIPAGVELRATIAPGTGQVLADPMQIHQVLANLFTNAWHALSDEPGIIEARLAPVTLDADAAAQIQGQLSAGRFIRISVSDTGHGMDAETLARVFEPFFTTKPLGKGTGLGLPVVHGIMQAHDGGITVRSAPGQGTTFDLYFPEVASRSPLPPAAVTQTVRSRGNGERILFIDDEEALVLLADRMLGRMGYRVSSFIDAREAIESFRKDPARFDLVITDHNMPGASGLQVAADLIALRPDVPIVLCSGHVTEELRTQARQVGIREVLYKPGTMEEFGDAIHRLICKVG